ncbi:MAG TPA: (2Fe-2S)-binding protein [Pseudonocardiaceae bacterium]|nr:(2Fe-2S)-binding protein [Pseudonocardiaceae bacterium]
MRLTVNDTDHAIDRDPDTPLLAVLREDLGLTAAKFGCGIGLCGACTVLADDHPVHACDTPMWAVRGKRIRTLEGLRDHPLPRAFVAEQAMQCGYCIAGIIMTSVALTERAPNPDEATVRQALDGNLCRCGAHNRIVRAILACHD